MQIKITLEETVLETLEAEAATLGIKVNAYIKLVLGKHVIDLKKGK